MGNADVLDIEILSTLWPFLVPDDATWCDAFLTPVKSSREVKKKIPMIIFPR